MNEFKVTILGNGSAVPTQWHHPSSQLIQYMSRRYLVDCGEGTQMQMIKFRLKNKTLDHIFISHLHGDHFYGLIGLINSFHLMKRNRPLHIYASNALEPLIQFQLKISNTSLVYPLVFHFLEDHENEVLFEDKYISIKAFPLKHSIRVWGFLFKEKTGRKRIRKSFVKKHKPTPEDISNILKGDDFRTNHGNILINNDITLPPHQPRSYAYCSDTAYMATTAEYVKGASLLYHESTFDNASRQLAKMTLHSTAEEAARVANEAGAKKLLIGHYSARYKALDELLEEARHVFAETYLSEEGETYVI